MGLGAALLLALLLTTDALRSDLTVSRWQDLVWLAWLGTLAYLVHRSRSMASTPSAVRPTPPARCAGTSGSPTSGLPIPFSFVTAVNSASSWVFGPATALLGRRRPELALAFFAVPFVNTPCAAPGSGADNAGLVTAI